MGEDNKGFLKRMVWMSSLGISMVLATFVGLYIGIYLDDKFSTKPWLTIIFLIIGIIAGFRNIYTVIKKYGF
ncbi:MAG: F0F1 ATP synthase subunit [Deltaproteobacteria bacterium RIFCSPLOWO2_12_FULL_43_16]|nr:MAG: F0F1 ATP synthase subunit [Deltaproteobacteria bacterium GWA2_43_19]OGQ11551.1 MAG: F0F1 ATP synthase subunit [Deltaproteobacteria bacterium RIFCSPHIGHO2_02_FULL_43_33]OGQ37128.1 MAG: F0F1 ATP synthase subunit [Deltaproteobacteria bacterium RIFCSPLOWO2_01_FULL_42_9]OGQ60864.1 MAG: F0F1 ATP synthase subunit [Deltaproteobacteria bacterium RIFCSPLOWO2_12_FULL_43_16]HBR16134.1 F0F1 ATP synthase subunit [Deltaproteobacteria bacterium]